MLIRQLVQAIKLGIRSKLFVCILVVVSAYCFGLSHNPYIRVASILGVLVTSEVMIMLWVPSFARMMQLSFTKQGSISWQEIPEFAKFRALAESQGVKLNTKRPFGLRKNFDNAYANPLTRRIVVGDLLLQRLSEGLQTALIGHEVTHIKRNHHIKLMLWTIIVPSIVMLPLWKAGAPPIVRDVVFYAVFFIVFLLISWHNEYDADVGAAEIAGVRNTITLLRKLVPRGQYRRESDTHPSVHSRILKVKRHFKQ